MNRNSTEPAQVSRLCGLPDYVVVKIGAGEGIRTLDPDLGKVTGC
jgi:hypothetical protein